MSRATHLLLLAFFVLLLSGCSSLFRDKSGDYAEATAQPPLKVPDEYQTKELVDLLYIPEVGDAEGATLGEVPRPTASGESGSTSAKVQKVSASSGGTTIKPERVAVEKDDDGDPLLLLRGLSLGESWSVVSEAMLRSGMVVTESDPLAGVYRVEGEAGCGANSLDGAVGCLYVVRLFQQDGDSALTVERADDTAISEEESVNFLNRLRDQML